MGNIRRLRGRIRSPLFKKEWVVVCMLLAGVLAGGVLLWRLVYSLQEDPLFQSFQQQDYTSVIALFENASVQQWTIKPEWWFYTGAALLMESYEETPLVDWEYILVTDAQRFSRGLQMLVRAREFVADYQLPYVNYLLGRHLLLEGKLYGKLAVEYLLEAEEQLYLCRPLCSDRVRQRVQVHLGLAYFVSEHYTESQRYLEQAYEEGDSLEIFSLLLRSYLVAFEGDKARGLLDRFIDVHPQALTQWEEAYLRALSLRFALRLEEASEGFLLLLESTPVVALLYQQLVGIYEQQQDFVKARYYRRQMLGLEPYRVFWEGSLQKLGHWIVDLV